MKPPRSIKRKFRTKNLIEKELKNVKSVLDVGCGRDSILKGINRPIYSVGIDYYEPYINKSKSEKIHNKYLLHDITRKLPFQENSFEVIICTEVIEHLSKEDGLNLLNEMERVAINKVILTTPNGLMIDLHPTKEDNPEEKHISGWETDELRELGYKVYGIDGFKFLKRDNGSYKYSPELISQIICFLFGYLTYYFPKLSYRLYFKKELIK